MCGNPSIKRQMICSRSEQALQKYQLQERLTPCQTSTLRLDPTVLQETIRELSYILKVHQKISLSYITGSMAPVHYYIPTYTKFQKIYQVIIITGNVLFTFYNLQK